MSHLKLATQQLGISKLSADLEVEISGCESYLPRLKAMLDLAMEQVLENFSERVHEQLGLNVLEFIAKVRLPAATKAVLTLNSPALAQDDYELSRDSDACTVRVDDAVVILCRNGGGVAVSVQPRGIQHEMAALAVTLPEIEQTQYGQLGFIPTRYATIR
ncbi:hypothetical protein [Pseudomonas sp. 2FE]|uniref:hypothetical protein n=1 Tax=Pseudomonas sp. 2FE TaxID=2502190 RepID=UPI0010F7B309|nr:hypothetical protein [Pseudomonas sp. 2FE]